MAKPLAKKPVAKSKAPSPAAKKSAPPARSNKAKPAKAAKPAGAAAKATSRPASKPAARAPAPKVPVSKVSAAKPAATKPAVTKPAALAKPAIAKPAPVAAKAKPAALVPTKHNGKHVSAVAKVPVRPPAEPPVVMPVPKPGQNAAGLKAKDLEFFRNLLLEKRRELLGDVHSMEMEALRSTSGSNLSNLPMHMADMGTDNYEQEFTLGLVEKDRQLLREIDLALSKIRDGTYGICEGTAKPITRARLEAKPWARYSIEYTIKLEKGLVRR